MGACLLRQCLPVSINKSDNYPDTAGWPRDGFATLEDARSWMMSFTQFYNNEHCHSGIRFVTPAQRHKQQDIELLEKRKAVYEKAKSTHPQRWAGRATRNWIPIGPVSLNPDREIRSVQAVA